MASTSPVFFATDRNDEGTLDYATRFGSRRLDPFEYSCGFLGAPSRHSGEPKLPPAPKTLTKGVEQCARLIVDKTRASGLKKVMFLIHGFNTGFDGLAWRALQVGSELDYDGTIVGWSWPSEGSAFGYAYDEDSDAWSEPHLVELVSEIAAQGPELQLDFVAHSMGNRILLQMLRELAQAHSTLRIGAAIFAAPDVAQDVFREQIRMVKKIGVLRTLYASEYDRAILISESYHKAPRAGSGGANILVAAGSNHRHQARRPQLCVRRTQGDPGFPRHRQSRDGGGGAGPRDARKGRIALLGDRAVKARAVSPMNGADETQRTGAQLPQFRSGNQSDENAQGQLGRRRRVIVAEAQQPGGDRDQRAQRDVDLAE